MRGVAKARAILAARGNVLDIRRHRALRSTISRMTARKELVEVLPRLYVPTDHREDPLTLLHALALWSPDCVVTGKTGWQIVNGEDPDLPFTVALPGTQPLPRWVRRMRRQIPPECVVEQHGIRCASPVYLAVESASTDGGEKLFTVLRNGQSKVDDLLPTLAMFRGSRGNVTRASITRQCLLKPWSFAEHQLQQLLLEHGITDWIANHAFVIDGVTVVVDLYFPAGLLVEFDSWEFHSSRDAFEADRRKQNLLAQCGLPMARITWQMLAEDPDGTISTIRDCLRAAAA